MKKTCVNEGKVQMRGSTFAFSPYGGVGMIGCIVSHPLLCQPGATARSCQILSINTI